MNPPDYERLREIFLGRCVHWYCHYSGSATNYSLAGCALAEALRR